MKNCAMLMCCALPLLCVSPVVGQEITVEKTAGPGPTDIFIVNRSKDPLYVLRIVVNQRETELCTLVPVEGPYGVTMILGDWQESVETPEMAGLLGERQGLDGIELLLGDELTAVAPKACGSVVELAIHTDQGIGSFSFR